MACSLMLRVVLFCTVFVALDLQQHRDAVSEPNKKIRLIAVALIEVFVWKCQPEMIVSGKVAHDLRRLVGIHYRYSIGFPR